jgi:hypothetical protein
MKTKNFFKILTLAVIVLFQSCSDDEEIAVSGLCPLVTSTIPANGALNVPLDQVISVTFNKQMRTSTITNESFSIEGLSPIEGTITFEDDASGTTVKFTPSNNLSEDTTYTGRIKTTVKDQDGNALQVAYVWSFTTGITIRPIVLATDPIDEATGVPLNKVITATFSEAMNPLSITNATFSLMNGTTNVPVTFDYYGALVTFTPTVNLLPNTTYTAKILSGVQNLSGVTMASDHEWTFTTGAIVAPFVVFTDPLNNATNVSLNKVIRATFSEVMNPTTINNSTFTLMNGTTLVPVSFSFTGAMVSFTPTSALLENTTYTATITTGAQNPAGNGITANYVWSFTTIGSAAGIPDIGSLDDIASFGGNAGVTNQGINTVIINGGIATTAASTLVTGFHDGLTGAIYTETPLNVGLVSGGIYTAPPTPGNATTFAIAQQALLDANALYIALSPAAMPGGIDPGAGELGGLTLAPGVYKSNSGTFNISNGNLTLDAQGDPNAVWVFQTASGLTVGIAGPTGAKSVNLINGASASNVFWQVGSTAIINSAGGGVMVGTIVTNSGVTLSTAGNTVQTVLNGRAISLVASVTMVNTTINVPN